MEPKAALADASASVVLGLMAVNVVWSAWDFSSVQAFLLSTTYGPLFPDVHALSVACVVMTMGALSYAMRSLPRGVLMGLATAGIHEFTFAYFALGSSVVITASYGLFYALVVGLALWAGSKRERLTLAACFASVFSYWVALYLADAWGWGRPVQAAGPIGFLTIGGWLVVCLPWMAFRK